MASHERAKADLNNRVPSSRYDMPKGSREGYHEHVVTTPMSNEEMKQLVLMSGIISAGTGMVVNKANLVRFAMARLAQQLASEDRNLIIADYADMVVGLREARRDSRRTRAEESEGA